MLKNALVYRIVQWNPPSSAELDERLATARFVECGATQPASAGWVEPRGRQHGALVESVGGQWLLQLCSETKAVPAAVVKRQLDERLDRAERDTGRRPKGKAAKEMKEEIVHDLLPRAFAKRGSTWVWIDAAAGRIVVDATGGKKADAIATRLMEVLGGGIALAPLQTKLSPAVAMARWLTEKEAPAGFSVDRDCELKQPDSDKACVRYARHTLDIDEVAQHIEQGKLPTQLAMTWAGRVSFVLTETLALKKIKLLDGVLEGAEARPAKDDDGFDADAAIVTGELGRLIPELIDALDGEIEHGAPAATGQDGPERLAA